MKSYDTGYHIEWSIKEQSNKQRYTGYLLVGDLVLRGFKSLQPGESDKGTLNFYQFSAGGNIVHTDV